MANCSNILQASFIRSDIRNSKLCVLLQLKLNRSQFTNWLCRQLTSSCKGKTPKLPADRKPGPPFTVLDEQQAQLQKMMAGMKVSGTDTKGGSRLGGIVVGKGVRGGGTGLGRIQKGRGRCYRHRVGQWWEGGGGRVAWVQLVGTGQAGAQGGQKGGTPTRPTHTQMCDCTHDYS